MLGSLHLSLLSTTNTVISVTEVSNISVYSVSSNNCTLSNDNHDISSCNSSNISSNYSPILKNVLTKKKSTLYKNNKSKLSSTSLPLDSSPPQLTSSPNFSLSSLSIPTVNEQFQLDYNNDISSTSCYSIPSLTSDSLSINSIEKANNTHSSLNCEFNVENHPLGESLYDDDNEIIQEVEDLSSQDTSSKSLFHSLKSKIKDSSLIKSAKSFYKYNTTSNITTNVTVEKIIEAQTKNLIFHDEVALETFQTTYKQVSDNNNNNSYLDSNNLFINIPRQRECRINPIFLRFFSIDSSIKINYPDQLLCENLIDYYQNQFTSSNCSTIDEFINKYFNKNNENNISNTNENNGNFKTMVKYSLLSRDKMWSKVILKPRNDSFTIEQTTSSMYIKVKDEFIKDGSLVRENGKIMPWCNLNDCTTFNKRCFKPKGILQNNIQYTVKNWENKRWSSC